jgi:hypothetical protein
VINFLEFLAPSAKGKLITEQTEVNDGSDEHRTEDSHRTATHTECSVLATASLNSLSPLNPTFFCYYVM